MATSVETQRLTTPLFFFGNLADYQTNKNIRRADAPQPCNRSFRQLTHSTAKDRQKGVREAGAADSAQCMPIDHLRVARTLFVTRAVEALDLAVHLAL
eukprot:CAMPEP_0183499334 /NCGR_PEP_ID=MMETSP0371-20130417/1586_1 /TAXON_ID=268820 /ORGANISM="Peridinium aciculiferum, Strain PAER-2" /LENGTH=97 /DNA_ID=CAMNT_0025693115 /DNA_START=72 /DNA_END=361 /DNA_ORIENTATION=-